MGMDRQAAAFAVSVGALLLGGARGAAFEIVTRGEARAAVVVPARPLAVVEYAAAELRHHVREASGATLEVVRENALHADRGNLIILGACTAAGEAGIHPERMPANAFVIRLKGGRLHLVGRDGGGAPLSATTGAGTLFAVYEFLEKALGVRWLWPGRLGEVIPERATVSVDAWDQETEHPYLLTNLWTPSFYCAKRGWSSKETHSRFLREQRIWLRRHRFLRSVDLATGHAFGGYWQRFGETHPEFFNLLADGRRAPLKHPVAVSLCVSEPALWDQIVRDWEEGRKKRPGINLNLCENDTPGLCTCARCEAWDPPGAATVAIGAEVVGQVGGQELRSLSDRYAKFYLAVQDRARRIDPDVRVFAYAYTNYCDPPLATRLNENVIVGVVPAMRFPWNGPERFRELWSGWRRAGATLFYRPNNTLYGHNMPTFYARKLAADFSFAAANGLIGTHFDSLTGQYATQGPSLYMLTRIHVRPGLPADRILDEYYGAFGKAESAVREYFAHWERVSNRVTPADMKRYQTEEGGGYSEWFLIAPRIFQPEIMAAGRALLDGAVAAARGDGLASRRVDFLRKGFTNAELTLATQAAYRQYANSAKDLKAQRKYHAALRKLYDYRHSIDGENICNMGMLAWSEARFWDVAAAEQKQPGEYLPMTWKFGWDPDKKGKERGWHTAACDDSGWSDILVDSCWEAQAVGKAWKKEHGADYDGFAWYRTSFDTPSAAVEGKLVKLFFGAIDEAAVIWVNGVQVLTRVYDAKVNPNSWAEPFTADVTHALRRDAPNVLAVRVEDNTGAGGVTRPVQVVVMDPPAAAEMNPVRNPGFENAQKPWFFAVREGAADLAIDGKDRNTGGASARITVTKPGAAKLWQSNIPISKGKRYVLKARFKTSADFNGRLQFRVAVTGSITRKAAAFNTGGQWQEIVLEDVKATAPAAYVGFYVGNGTGVVWLDDVELVEVK